jgi:hypothetical protein
VKTLGEITSQLLPITSQSGEVIRQFEVNYFAEAGSNWEVIGEVILRRKGIKNKKIYLSSILTSPIPAYPLAFRDFPLLGIDFLNSCACVRLRGGVGSNSREVSPVGWAEAACQAGLRYYQGLFLPVTPSVAVMRFLFVFVGSEHAQRHYCVRVYVRSLRRAYQ